MKNMIFTLSLICLLTQNIAAKPAPVVDVAKVGEVESKSETGIAVQKDQRSHLEKIKNYLLNHRHLLTEAQKNKIKNNRQKLKNEAKNHKQYIKANLGKAKKNKKKAVKKVKDHIKTKHFSGKGNGGNGGNGSGGEGGRNGSNISTGDSARLLSDTNLTNEAAEENLEDTSSDEEDEDGQTLEEQHEESIDNYVAGRLNDQI